MVHRQPVKHHDPPVDGKVVLGDVGLNVVVGPVIDGRELVASGARVRRQDLDVRSPSPLRPPQAIDHHGRGLPGKVLEQRRLLAQAAALGLAVGAREELLAVLVLLLLDGERGIERDHVQLKTPHVLVAHPQGFEEVVAGIEEQDLVAQAELMVDVHEHDRRLLHARQQHQVVREGLGGP